MSQLEGLGWSLVDQKAQLDQVLALMQAGDIEGAETDMSSLADDVDSLESQIQETEKALQDVSSQMDSLSEKLPSDIGEPFAAKLEEVSEAFAAQMAAKDVDGAAADHVLCAQLRCT